MKKLIKIFWFNGRINRLEYLISMAIIWPITILLSTSFPNTAEWLIPVLFFPYLTQGSKRCQDRNINGIWILNPANFIFNFTEKGTKEENNYGRKPNQIFE